MHQRKGKKILIYFLLLITVGSINSANVNTLQFKKIKDINIVGLGDYDNMIILNNIKNLNLSNIFLITKKEIQSQIDTNSLVEKYEIFKRYPSSLDIKIEKTKFLARINYKEKIFLLGSNGQLSKNDFFNNELPFIFGNPNIDQFLNFKKIIDQSKFSYNEVEKFYYFSSNRWDLKLKNNIIIKLPSNHIEEALRLAFDFLHNNDFNNIKIVDARIENQIILND